MNSRMDEMTDRLQQALEMAREKGADGAKLSYAHAEKTESQYEAGRLKTVSTSESASYSVEVLAGGRLGRTRGNRLDAMEEMIDRAIALATVGPEAHFDAYPNWKQLPHVQAYAESTANLTREELTDAAGRIVRAVQGYDPDLYTMASGQRQVSEHVLVTTGGVRHAGRRTEWSIGGFAQRTGENDMVMDYDARSWGDASEHLDPDAIGEQIVGDFQQAETTAQSPRGKVSLILPPRILEMMLTPLELGINGRNVLKGDSPLAGRLDEQVLSEALTLRDEPHIPHAPDSRELDDNGIPTRGHTLLERGRLRMFLYDLDTAGQAGAEPTGNRYCEPYNLVLEPGEASHEQLIGDVTDGILVRHLIGFGQGNLINGDFSANVGLGFRVRNGEITGRIKNTMISGNLYDLLAGEVRLSSDTNYTGRMPWAVLEGADASARA
ncbi:MAG: TldD/PmbA family protein [Planctomycetota bacterium]